VPVAIRPWKFESSPGHHYLQDSWFKFLIFKNFDV